MADKITRVTMTENGWVREDGLDMPSIRVFIFPDYKNPVSEENGREEVWLWSARPIPEDECDQQVAM